MGPEALGLASPCLLSFQGIQSAKRGGNALPSMPFPAESSLVLPNRAGPNAQAVSPLRSAPGLGRSSPTQARTPTTSARAVRLTVVGPRPRLLDLTTPTRRSRHPYHWPRLRPPGSSRPTGLAAPPPSPRPISNPPPGCPISHPIPQPSAPSSSLTSFELLQHVGQQPRAPTLAAYHE